MAEATCSACSGRGGAFATEAYDGDPAAGEVWEPCSVCGGTGTVWTPDEGVAEPAEEPPPARPPRPPRAPRARWGARPARLTPERLDRSFITFLVLIFAGLVGWFAFLTPFLQAVNLWVVLAVYLVLVGLLWWWLTRIPRAIHILRLGFAWFLVLGLAFGMVLLIYLALR